MYSKGVIIQICVVKDSLCKRTQCVLKTTTTKSDLDLLFPRKVSDSHTGAEGSGYCPDRYHNHKMDLYEHYMCLFILTSV